MDFKRDLYSKRLISYMWDGQVKVITGIRRCGKSCLLRSIFRSFLLRGIIFIDTKDLALNVGNF